MTFLKFYFSRTEQHHAAALCAALCPAVVTVSPNSSVGKLRLQADAASGLQVGEAHCHLVLVSLPNRRLQLAHLFLLFSNERKKVNKKISKVLKRLFEHLLQYHRLLLFLRLLAHHHRLDDRPLLHGQVT